MKKPISLFLMFLVGININGQESKFQIGASLTPTITSLLSEKIVEHTEPTISLAPSVNFEYRLHKNISITASCSYENVGIYYHILETDENGIPYKRYFQDKLAISYLSLPLMISFHTSGPLRYYINVGAFFGIGLSQEPVHPIGYSRIIYQAYAPVKYEKNTAGISGGFGVLIPCGPRWLSEIGLRTNIGLKDIAKDLSEPRTRTGLLGLQVGMKYKL